MKSLIKQKRLAIYREIDRLNQLNDQQGIDVSLELLECGQQLEMLSGEVKQETDEVHIPKELIVLAESNGIRYGVLKKRIYTTGWDPMVAATTPIKVTKRLMPTEVGLTAEKYRHLKEEGKMLDKEIRETYNISQHTLLKFKRQNNLTDVKRIRKGECK